MNLNITRKKIHFPSELANAVGHSREKVDAKAHGPMPEASQYFQSDKGIPHLHRLLEKKKM
jgi:hypothetical protein